MMLFFLPPPFLFFFFFGSIRYSKNFGHQGWREKKKTEKGEEKKKNVRKNRKEVLKYFDSLNLKSILVSG